jgi:outer membrane assembly lipoprotein YfiO
MKRKYFWSFIFWFIVIIFFSVSSRGDIRRPPRPRSEVKVSPRDQSRRLWEKGRVFEDKQAWARAISSYETLVEDYPDSELAPEALFRLATCLERRDELYRAFQAYQRLLEEYPGKGNLKEILSRQFRIGEKFLQGRKRSFLFLRIRSGLDTAAEIFRAVVRNATFSEFAPLAQYNLALALQQGGDYDEAELEYDSVLDNYPGSKVFGPAIFQKGVCAWRQSLGSNYDQKKADQAIKRFTFFLKRFPDDLHCPEAEKLLNELLSRKAEKCYEIARYYERKDSPQGARLYYEEVIEKYPGTPWSDRAKEKLARLKD